LSKQNQPLADAHLILRLCQSVSARRTKHDLACKSVQNPCSWFVHCSRVKNEPHLAIESRRPAIEATFGS
jgi:hypothetical protein